MLNPENCIVIEDAEVGILSAYNAKIGKVIAIGPKTNHEYLSKIKGVDQIISNLDEFDRNQLVI